MYRYKSLVITISQQSSAAGSKPNEISSAHLGFSSSAEKICDKLLLLFNWCLGLALTLAFGLHGFVWSVLLTLL